MYIRVYLNTKIDETSCIISSLCKPSVQNIENIKYFIRFNRNEFDESPHVVSDILQRHDL